MIVSPTIHTAGLAGLEFAINQALSLDPATQIKLSQLKGHVFHLAFTSPELDFYLIPGDKDISLYGIYPYDADTKLCGSANEFIKLATANDPANALINGELELHGDSNALIALQKIGQQLDLDWEAPLADLFGDVVGHQIGKTIRSGFKFANQAFKNFKRQTEEYIKEESDLLPPKWQIESFYDDVTQLKMRTERLEARINKLRQTIASR